MWPLNTVQFKAMIGMQKIAPQLKKLQAKYKEDPTKLQQEQMQLYRDSGVNPLAGCWPTLLQIPILFSVFYAITEPAHNALFKSSGWLWIGSPLADKFPQIFAASLFAPDVLLIVLYAASQYVSMRYATMPPSDPAQAQQMKIMQLDFARDVRVHRVPRALAVRDGACTGSRSTSLRWVSSSIFCGVTISRSRRSTANTPWSKRRRPWRPPRRTAPRNRPRKRARTVRPFPARARQNQRKGSREARTCFTKTISKSKNSPPTFATGRSPARDRARAATFRGAAIAAPAPRRFTARPVSDGPGEPIAHHELPEAAKPARDLLDRILTQMGIPQTEIHYIPRPEGEYLEVTGPDLAALIGRHGNTLEALNLIFNNVLNAGNRSNRRYYTIDAEGYRARRADQLKQSTFAVVERCLREKQPRRARTDASVGAQDRAHRLGRQRVGANGIRAVRNPSAASSSIPSSADTIAAIATPPGKGAIAIVRVSGPRSPRVGVALGALRAPASAARRDARDAPGRIRHADRRRARDFFARAALVHRAKTRWSCTCTVRR